MLLPRRTGWSGDDPPHNEKRGIEDLCEWLAHQAHESIRHSSAPAGTAGVAGCPEQKAPELGRGA